MKNIEKSTFKVDKELIRISDIVMKDVLGAKSGESMLIVTNPEEDPLSISQSLFNSAVKYEVEPIIIVQQRRSSADSADPRVLAAISTMPDIYASVSSLRLGQDLGFKILDQEYKRPYIIEDNEREHVFRLARVMGRGFWSPTIRIDVWKRLLSVDYQHMQPFGGKIAGIVTNAEEVFVETEKGTHLTFGCKGMTAASSTGDYKEKGKGGNLPTGEDFITPEPGTMNGEIVFDGGFGGLSYGSGSLFLKNPIKISVKNGRVEHIDGKEEAEILKREIALYTKRCYEMAEKGNFDPEKYAFNVKNIGEFGLGLNPRAELREDSSLLEWEKVLGSCHFAIGYDFGADASKGPPLNQTLNHFDGLIKKPSVIVDGEPLMQKGSYTVQS